MDPYDAALDALDDALLEDSKPKVRALAKKFYEAGLLRERDYNEILRVAADREMGADDVATEIRVSLDAGKGTALTTPDDTVRSIDTLRAQGLLDGAVTPELTRAIEAGDTAGALDAIIKDTSGKYTPLEILVTKALRNISGPLPSIKFAPTLGATASGDVILGEFNPVDDAVTLVAGTADSQTFLHEMVHAFTHRLVQMQLRDGITIPAMRDLRDIHDMLTKEHKSLLGDFAATDLTEFVAQAMSSKEFQLRLMGIPYKKVSMFLRFTRAVGKLLGLDMNSKEHNVLMASIASVDGLMGRGRALQQMARGQKLDDIQIAYTTQMAQAVDTPIGELTPRILADVASAPTQETRTAKHKFMSTFAQQDVPFADRFRQQAVDALAPIATKLEAAFSQGIRNTFGDINPIVWMRQAVDHGRIAGRMFVDGTIRLRADGLWEASILKDVDGNPVSAQKIIQAIKSLSDSQGLSYEQGKAKLSTIFEAMRLTDLRAHNQTIEAEAQKLTSAGDVDGAYELRKEKFPLHMLNAEIDAYKAVFDDSPEIQSIQKMMNAVRGGMIDAMVASGRLPAKQADAWKSASNYVPFERLQDVMENPDEVFNRGRTGLAAIRQLPKLKGSFVRPVTNTIDSYMDKLAWMTDQSMRNSASARTLKIMAEAGYARRVESKSKAANSNLVLPAVYENGKPLLYEVENEYDFIAFSQSPEPKGAIISVFGKASRLLRTTVTATPQFALAQVIMDAPRAMFHSGVKNPAAVLARTLYNFPRAWYALALNANSKIVRDISRAGIVGDVDFNPVNPVEILELDTGAVKRSLAGAIIHRLEQVTKASDMAARLAVYEQTLAEGGDVTLAETRARELINFNRRGASSTMRVLTHVIPFFNAWAQGTDLLYRGFTGKDSPSGLSRDKARAAFIRKVGYMTALGTMYAMAMSDDEQYAELANDVRDRNWIMPKFIRDNTGIEKLPVPVEFGFLFKSIPERTVQYLKESARGEGKSGIAAVGETLTAAAFTYGMTPTPTLLKPILENLTNYSFFTQRALVPASLSDMPEGMQSTSSTSELAKSIGAFTDVSPIKIDNALRGYFGLMGSTTLYALDPLMNPNKPDRALNQLPFLSIALLPPVGSRTKNEFYDFREKVVQAVRGANSLKNDPQAYEAFVAKNGYLMSAAPYVNNKLRILSQLRAQRKLIESYQGDDMTSDQKREMIDELSGLEVEALEDIREVRSAVMKEKP